MIVASARMMCVPIAVNFDRACGIPIKAIHQNRVQNRSLIHEVGLARGRINIGLDGPLVTVADLRLLPRGARRNKAAIGTLGCARR